MSPNYKSQLQQYIISEISAKCLDDQSMVAVISSNHQVTPCDNSFIGNSLIHSNFSAWEYEEP